MWRTATHPFSTWTTLDDTPVIFHPFSLRLLLTKTVVELPAEEAGGLTCRRRRCFRRFHCQHIPLTYHWHIWHIWHPLTSIDIHWPFVTQKIPQDAVGNLETSGRKTSWKPSAGLPGAWGNLCRSFGTPFTFAVDLVYCIWIDFSIGTGRPHFCALTTKSSELLKMWKMFGAWGVDSRV